MSAWQERNAQMIQKLALKTRKRDVPDTGVVLGMEAGKVYAPKELPRIAIAPGVKAAASWGRGTLLEVLKMEAGAQYPEQVIAGELIMLVEAGSGVCHIDGRSVELEKGSIFYLTEGMRRSLQAGQEGLEALDIFSPVRADHLKLAGVPLPVGVDGSFPDLSTEPPSHQAGKVYRFDELVVTPIIMPGKTAADPITARTRLIWGRHFMLSFVEMDAHTSFPMHIHPEDQLMLVREGVMEEGIIDEWLPMRGDQRHIILQPGGMIHGAKLSPQGARVVDVFWPVRPDYLEMGRQQAEPSS
jgi:gluconolactonase